MRTLTTFALTLLLAGSSASAQPSTPTDGWPAYGRDAGGTRASSADQITPKNVQNLEVAWTFHTGALDDARRAVWHNATFEATPILAEGSLYLCTGFATVIALDPESGKERWRFDPKIDLTIGRADLACRGVSSWIDTATPTTAACHHRIILATVDARLFALDGATGKPCGDFGNAGVVNLAAGIDHAQPGRFGVTSPPAIVGDTLILGSAIGDNQRKDDAHGVVRAYDLLTGTQRWSWDPIPRDASDPAWSSWLNGSAASAGAANAWSILSADPERDLVFVPTGSASPDFYGGQRPGENRYANSVVALRASTGKVVWHFQVVHHDLWDYDIPAQPVLITVRRDGRHIPAVAQATKMGHVFILHRETGEPIFPIEERQVPASTIPGEWTSPTQPFPTFPPPLVPQTLTPADAWGLTPWDRAWCRDKIASLKYGSIFTPPSLEGTVIYPGNAGGTNWGSVAFADDHQLLFVNTTNAPTVVKLIPRADFAEQKRLNPTKEISPQAGTDYAMRRDFDALLSPLGIPCNAPPWGKLTAIDLAHGTIAWETPLGTTRDIAPVPISIHWGTPNMGGPIVTAGGLVFIGAAMDNYLRAFDAQTGEELWKGRLPAGGQATPMTYRLRPDGKQYVVIAAGGHGRLTTTLGDAVVAFALP